ATPSGAGPPLRPAVLERLLEDLADANPVGLYGEDRYAVQLTVEADGSLEALARGLDRWREASSRRLGLAAIVRAEVMTTGEFDAQLAAALAEEGIWVTIESLRGRRATDCTAVSAAG